ncbi:MAG: DUF6062 family protein [Oscillospiraceae bacterium]|jgi:hypothetical protein|nr:DUF6062 family protein [Oscillospiraceae bacterium]
MRYHIDTIPVWDAYKKDSECPLCDLQAANEAAYLDNFLGASVMEPAVRIEVNAKGFCRKHFAQMLGMQNRLGLALMTHTHLKETLAHLTAPTPAKGGLFGKKATTSDTNHPDDTCVLCERLRETMNRYCYTVLHLYKTDAEFRRVLEGGKGLCLPHYQQLSRMAGEEFGGEKGQAFQGMLYELQRRNMERVEKELEWFTLKFDYRNADKPWGESKDAPERAILKLRGK